MLVPDVTSIVSAALFDVMGDRRVSADRSIDLIGLGQVDLIDELRGVAILRANPRRSFLGLGWRSYDRLISLTDVVVVGLLERGAEDDWAAGLRQITQFAGRSEATIYFVSNGYGDEASRSAEAVVRESGLRNVILRTPDGLVRTRTGAGARTPPVHRVLEAALSGHISVSKQLNRHILDPIPSALVAKVILRLIGQDVQHGEFWITAAESAPPATAWIRGAQHMGELDRERVA